MTVEPNTFTATTHRNLKPILGPPSSELTRVRVRLSYSRPWIPRNTMILALQGLVLLLIRRVNSPRGVTPISNAIIRTLTAIVVYRYFQPAAAARERVESSRVVYDRASIVMGVS
jgi:hypothetical protein